MVESKVKIAIVASSVASVISIAGVLFFQRFLAKKSLRDYKKPLDEDLNNEVDNCKPVNLYDSSK